MLFTIEENSYDTIKKEVVNLGCKFEFYDSKCQIKINKRLIKKLTTELLYSYCTLKQYGCGGDYLYIKELTNIEVLNIECSSCKNKNGNDICLDQYIYLNNIIDDIRDDLPLLDEKFFSDDGFINFE